MSILIKGMDTPKYTGEHNTFDRYGGYLTVYGRLIDADEFLKNAKKYLSNSQNEFYRVSLVQIFKDILDSAETIIEEEK